MITIWFIKEDEVLTETSEDMSFLNSDTIVYNNQTWEIFEKLYDFKNKTYRIAARLKINTGKIEKHKGKE